MTMALKLQGKKSQRDVGGLMQVGESFITLMKFSKKISKSVLYIQDMHLIMPYISLGYRLH